MVWGKIEKLKNAVLVSLILTTTIFGQSAQDKIAQPESAQNKICYINDEGSVLERKTCPKTDDEKDVSLSIKNDLSFLFSIVNVPLGMSLAFENVDANEITKNINPKSYVIKDLLDQIVETDSRYKWKEYSGVINIFSENDYSILETRIPEFKVENEYPWKMDELLVQTKEFQSYLRERNLIDKIPDPDNKLGFLFIGFIGKPDPRQKISIDLKNATVREILNEIVRKKGYGIWIYREYNLVSDGKFYQMYRLEFKS